MADARLRPGENHSRGTRRIERRQNGSAGVLGTLGAQDQDQEPSHERHRKTETKENRHSLATDKSRGEPGEKSRAHRTKPADRETTRKRPLDRTEGKSSG
jgi:hypothetical protein